MRIQKFLEVLLEKTQNNSNIHLPTLKLVVKLFYKYLSVKEKTRWQYTINVITSFTSIQQTLKQNIEMRKTMELDTELKQLKGEPK